MVDGYYIRSLLATVLLLGAGLLGLVLVMCLTGVWGLAAAGFATTAFFAYFYRWPAALKRGRKQGAQGFWVWRLAKAPPELKGRGGPTKAGF